MLNTLPSDIPTTSSSSEPLEEGTYPAIINMLVDLGLQETEDYSTKEITITHQMWIGLQFPTEIVEYEDENGKKQQRPKVLGKQVLVSSDHRSWLTRFHSSVCSHDETYLAMLLKPVTASIGLTKGGKPKITSVGKPMKGSNVKLFKGTKPIVVDDTQWDDEEALETLPNFIAEMIRNRVDK